MIRSRPNKSIKYQKLYRKENKSLDSTTVIRQNINMLSTIEYHKLENTNERKQEESDFLFIWELSPIDRLLEMANLTFNPQHWF